MTDSLEGHDSGDVVDPQLEAPMTPTIDPVPRRPAFRLLAAILSCLIPGFGELVSGNKRRALISFSAFLVLVLLYWPVRLPLWYRGFIALIFLGWSLSCCSGCMALTVASKKAQPASKWWFLLTIPVALVLSLSVVMTVGLRLSGFRVFTIPSSSMSATIVQGDEIVADMKYFRHKAPKDGEIVIFRHHGLFLIKRIVALAGERVSSSDGIISVNGRELDEAYAHHTGDASPEMNTFPAVLVPPGQVFVLGDNRDFSLDSRMPAEFGTVSVEDLAGVPLYIFTSKQDRTGRSIE